MAGKVRDYNQQNSDGTWWHVTEWDDGTYTHEDIADPTGGGGGGSGDDMMAWRRYQSDIDRQKASMDDATRRWLAQFDRETQIQLLQMNLKYQYDRLNLLEIPSMQQLDARARHQMAQDAAISYAELSGWIPKGFEEDFVNAAKTLMDATAEKTGLAAPHVSTEDMAAVRNQLQQAGWGGGTDDEAVKAFTSVAGQDPNQQDLVARLRPPAGMAAAAAPATGAAMGVSGQNYGAGVGANIPMQQGQYAVPTVGGPAYSPAAGPGMAGTAGALGATMGGAAAGNAPATSGGGLTPFQPVAGGAPPGAMWLQPPAAATAAATGVQNPNTPTMQPTNTAAYMGVPPGQSPFQAPALAQQGALQPFTAAAETATAPALGGPSLAAAAKPPWKPTYRPEDLAEIRAQLKAAGWPGGSDDEAVKKFLEVAGKDASQQALLKRLRDAMTPPNPNPPWKNPQGQTPSLPQTELLANPRILAGNLDLLGVKGKGADWVKGLPNMTAGKTPTVDLLRLMGDPSRIAQSLMAGGWSPERTAAFLKGTTLYNQIAKQAQGGYAAATSANASPFKFFQGRQLPVADMLKWLRMGDPRAQMVTGLGSFAGIDPNQLMSEFYDFLPKGGKVGPTNFG